MRSYKFRASIIDKCNSSSVYTGLPMLMARLWAICGNHLSGDLAPSYINTAQPPTFYNDHKHLPAHQRDIIAMESIAIVQRGKAFAQEKIRLPPLKQHQVYVKVEYAAFNPTDRKAGILPIYCRNADHVQGLHSMLMLLETVRFWAATLRAP